MRSAEPEDEPLILPPHQRYELIGHEQAERHLREMLDGNTLSNGWMITGPEGLGKATLAYRIARAFLDRESLLTSDTLETGQDAKFIRLLHQKAHPDLFIAEREYDEKKQRYATVISVEKIRELISFMALTSSTGRRVAIIDTADALNKNAANALLKVLEEPPANTLVLLLANMPGRLLPTIRSRCRVVNLAPLPDDVVAGFIQREAELAPDLAQELATISGGRPGHALALAMGEGAAALPLVNDFLAAGLKGKSLAPFADKLSPKAAEDLWHSFTILLLEKISLTARGNAGGVATEGPLSHLPAPVLVRLWEAFSDLINRGTALNTDKGQMIIAMGIKLADLQRSAHAA
jgi:DNA polymerase-3 subunit delta'